MSIVTLTPAAYFYAVFSQHLHHAHALLLYLARVGQQNVICHLEGFAAPHDVLDAEAVHLLHKLQSKHYHETEQPHIGGLAGWQERTLDVGYYRSARHCYYHRTATDRLALWVTARFSPDERFGFDVYTGNGQPVAGMIYSEGSWYRSPRTSLGEEIDWHFSEKENSLRPDRYIDVAACLYDEQCCYILPGQAPHEVFAPLAKCLEGEIPTEAEIAALRGKPEPDRFPLDPELVELIEDTE